MKGNSENRGQVAVRGADIRRLLADVDAAPGLLSQSKRRRNARFQHRNSRCACFCHGPYPPCKARQFAEAEAEAETVAEAETLLWTSSYYSVASSNSNMRDMR